MPGSRQFKSGSSIFTVLTPTTIASWFDLNTWPYDLDKLFVIQGSLLPGIVLPSRLDATFILTSGYKPATLWLKPKIFSLAKSSHTPTLRSTPWLFKILIPSPLIIGFGSFVAITTFEIPAVISKEAQEGFFPIWEPVSYTHLTLPTKRIV